MIYSVHEKNTEYTARRLFGTRIDEDIRWYMVAIQICIASIEGRTIDIHLLYGVVH